MQDYLRMSYDHYMPNFFDALKISSGDPRFLSRVFSTIAKGLKGEQDPLKQILQEEFDHLSIRLDRSLFQESCQVRANLRARKVAELLISNDGELDLSQVLKGIEHLKNHCYSLGPERQHDSPRQKHLLNALETLAHDREVQRELKLITRPYSNKLAEQIIRNTLQLPQNHAITDADVRRAVLSAWFCYLRQNVGSCFATAPAIILQQEQPIFLFKDIRELLDTGRIKRTFGGHEYAAPLSSSAGSGEFKKQVPVNSSDTPLSPGLTAALEAVGLTAQAKEEMENIHSFLSAEELIRFILMKAHTITEKDLRDYENKPRGPMQTGLYMPLSQGKSKDALCAAFYKDLETAKTAFNALTENFLLKMWEFSLASFAETKPGFTRWNMYASLGFNTDQPGGIGAFLYADIKKRLDQANDKVKELQLEYEQVYTQLKFIEGRLRQASTEKEAQWGRIEYESKRGEFRTLEEIRDKEHFKAERLASLLNDLLETYDQLFPRYFQEVYDPDMHEVSPGLYDDSPAGFRLLYKHGRENTSQWNLIYTHQEFIEYLSSFFVMTEPEIVHAPEFQGLEQELSHIITGLVTHVRSDEFLISAFDRMADAHQTARVKNPLDHLEQVQKKPWAYTSGGTLNNLISCYFRLEEVPRVTERWVENELELLVFFVDTMKSIPYSILERFLTSENRSFLAHSPTHAFTFRPAFPLLKTAIETEGFSYTWIRDHLVRPAETFIEYMFLDQEMIRFLLQKLIQLVPKPLHTQFNQATADCVGRKTPLEFRRYFDHAVDSRLLNLDQIDSALFNWLPLSPQNELKNRAERILEDLPGVTPNTLSILDQCVDNFGPHLYATAGQLQDICKAALLISLNSTSTPIDYPALINQSAQKLGYALVPPILFGDTNWIKDWFAFVVNPGTAELELWRVDPIGRTGVPMRDWKRWLNGTDRTRTWGLFTKPHEYH